jgi:hypothetical protein
MDLHLTVEAMEYRLQAMGFYTAYQSQSKGRLTVLGYGFKKPM